MLILTRNIGEAVVIGKDIYCTVLGVKGNQVRLGFDAPKALPIHRKEIHDQIALENEGTLPMRIGLIAGANSLKHSASTTH